MDASTKDLIAKANSFKIYNNVQFTGKGVGDLKLTSGYYDKDGTITIGAVPAGYDYKLN